MEQTRDLTQGKPMGLIFRFALPLMLGSICQQLYTMVDTAVVGQGLGISALASLGAADWLNWLILGIAMGFSEGFCILVSQRFGAKDEKALRKTVAMIILLAGIISVVFTIAAHILARPVLVTMNTPTTVLGGALEYLRVTFSGITIVMAYNVTASFLRAMGNSKSPLIAMLIASCINIVLDLLFVLVFHWGIAGAAIATVISQCFSFLYCLWILVKIPAMHLKKEDWKPDGAVIGHLLRLGLPTAFQNGIIAAGGMVVQSVINGFGEIFIAGYTATNKIYGLLELAASAYGSAVSAFTGQNLGAKKYIRIKNGIKSAVIMSLVTSVIISAIMISLGRFIVSLFISGDPSDVQKTVSIAYEFLCIMASFLPVLYMLYVHRSGLMGMGDTVTPMLSGFIEMVMRIGTVYLLTGIIGGAGAFWAEVTAWTGAAVLLTIVFYVHLKKFLRQSRNEEAQMRSDT